MPAVVVHFPDTLVHKSEDPMYVVGMVVCYKVQYNSKNMNKLQNTLKGENITTILSKYRIKQIWIYT